MAEIEAGVANVEQSEAEKGGDPNWDSPKPKPAAEKSKSKKQGKEKAASAEKSTTKKTAAKSGKEKAMPATKEKTTRKRNTKTPAKASTKRASGDAPARSMARTTGETLLPLLGNRDGRKIAQRLANNETVGKRDLEKLRDIVNESAASAREGDKATLASKLSNANRLVRRLARQA